MVITKKRRITAAIMCIVLLLVIAFSALYIVTEVHHDCSGDSCPICHEIQVCRQVLNTVGTAALVFVTCFSAVFILLTAFYVYSSTAEAVTLISLKVKLSD